MKQIAKFWRWFADNNKRFRTIKTSTREQLLDEIMDQLHDIDEGLFLEISVPQDGVNDFVITAEGRQELFELVDEIIAAAPALPGWTFTALRPPLGFDFTMDFGALQLDPAELWFMPMTAGDDEEHFGVQIGIPKLKRRDEEAALNACHVLLDTGLGERRAADEIEHVEVAPLPANPDDEGFIRLVELPQYLKWRRKQRSRKM